MHFQKLLSTSILMILTTTNAQQSNDNIVPFIGLRGKKNDANFGKEVSIIDFDNSDKLEENADEFRSPMTKRATLGFQGMRGKKFSETEPLKKYVGFAGMRGKKLGSYLYPRTDDLEDYWSLRNELAKRKFYGMRGKRPNAMGFRGKKDPSPTSFFGTRGKKNYVPVPLNDEDNVESLSALIYTLTHNKDYLKTIDLDSTDFGSQNSLDQQLSSSDGNGA